MAQPNLRVFSHLGVTVSGHCLFAGPATDYLGLRSRCRIAVSPTGASTSLGDGVGPSNLRSGLCSAGSRFCPTGCPCDVSSLSLYVLHSNVIRVWKCSVSHCGHRIHRPARLTTPCNRPCESRYFYRRAEGRNATVTAFRMPSVLSAMWITESSKWFLATFGEIRPRQILFAVSFSLAWVHPEKQAADSPACHPPTSVRLLSRIENDPLLLLRYDGDMFFPAIATKLWHSSACNEQFAGREARRRKYERVSPTSCRPYTTKDR